MSAFTPYFRREDGQSTLNHQSPNGQEDVSYLFNGKRDYSAQGLTNSCLLIEDGAIRAEEFVMPAIQLTVVPDLVINRRTERKERKES